MLLVFQNQLKEEKAVEDQWQKAETDVLTVILYDFKKEPEKQYRKEKEVETQRRQIEFLRKESEDGIAVVEKPMKEQTGKAIKRRYNRQFEWGRSQTCSD